MSIGKPVFFVTKNSNIWPEKVVKRLVFLASIFLNR